MTIKIPGFAGAEGGDIKASDALMSSTVVVFGTSGTRVVADDVADVVPSVSLPFIVEVEVDLPPNEFFKGPRWVSLNSRADLLALAIIVACVLTLGKIPRHVESVSVTEMLR